MREPKMILFDYGHTLLYEPGFDSVRGTRAVLDYAVRNENRLTAEEVAGFSDELFRKVGRLARANGIEIHNLMFQKMLYEYLQIGFSIPQSRVEEIYWDNAAPGIAMPNVGKAMHYLKANGIRSGVISNLSYSGGALENRLNRLLPDNEFEFVIASSEYVVRKPDPMIFELALRKAHLPADEVWYCGDNTKWDVYGAASAGIFPVWYLSPLDCSYRDKSLDVKPDCEHLFISDWLQLVGFLEKLKKETAGTQPRPEGR